MTNTESKLADDLAATTTGDEQTETLDVRTMGRVPSPSEVEAYIRKARKLRAQVLGGAIMSVINAPSAVLRAAGKAGAKRDELSAKTRDTAA